jgi:hypothetical protein
LRSWRPRPNQLCFAQVIDDEQRQTGKAGLVSRLGRGAGPGAVAASPAGGVRRVIAWYQHACRERGWPVSVASARGFMETAERERRPESERLATGK